MRKSRVHLLFLSFELNRLRLLSEEGEDGRDFDFERALSSLADPAWD